MRYTTRRASEEEEEARLSWDISALGASMEVAAVEGDLPFLKLLKLVRVLLELRPLLTLAVSALEGDTVTAGEEVIIGPAGTTSQWARKCSPKTELYGLQTLWC